MGALWHRRPERQLEVRGFYDALHRVRDQKLRHNGDTHTHTHSDREGQPLRPIYN